MHTYLFTYTFIVYLYIYVFSLTRKYYKYLIRYLGVLGVKKKVLNIIFQEKR